MIRSQRLTGVLVCLSLGTAVPAAADVVTDWSAITITTIGAGAPVAGPGRLIEYAMVHIAMHDAVQSIQQRFETFSPGIMPATGSVIAAAAKAAHDVLVNRFPAQTATLDAAYADYLAAHQIASNDPGIAAGAQAASACILGRVHDGTYPVPAPQFFWRHCPWPVAAHGSNPHGRAHADGSCVDGHGEAVYGAALLPVFCAWSSAHYEPPVHPRLQRSESAREERGLEPHPGADRDRRVSFG